MLASEEAFLPVCVKKDNHYRPLTISPVICQYTEKPLGWVGVFLAFEIGNMSFLMLPRVSLQ
jgi:tripartite motif-containing protein 43/48/49/64/77